MPVESSSSGFVAYFVDALSYKVAGEDVSSAEGAESLRAEPLSTPATRGLLAIGEASRGPVIKALRHRDPLTRVRAAYVLGQLRPIDSRAVKELVALLGDVAEAIQSEALLSLVRLGPEAAGEIVKSLQSKNLQARQLAALALSANGSIEPRVSTLAIEALRRSNCARRIGLARAASNVQGEFQSQFIESLADCVRETGSLRTLALEMMRKIGVLTPSAVEKIAQFVREPKLELSARLQILESLALERTDCAPVEGLMLELLDSADNPSKLRIIDIIGRCSTLSEQAIEKLFKVAAGDGNEHLVRGRTYSLLGRLKPENSEYSRYFLKELKSDRWQWALGDIARLPNEAELALLVGALKDFPEELKHIPAEGLSHIEPVTGPISAETLALLLNGLASVDGQYRNQALIALIHLDPSNSVIPAALRHELEGRFRERVIVPAIYREIPAIFDAIVAAPDSYVQFQAARKAQRLGK
jgi:HEAT repeat protein